MLAGFFYLKRAENETRTRDPNLGKVMLYQLSYFRIVTLRASGFPDCECKGNAFSETSKTLGYFFHEKLVECFRMHSHKGIHPAQYQAFRLRLSRMRTAGSPARISADNQTSFFSARKEKRSACTFRQIRAGTSAIFCTENRSFCTKA